MGRVRSRKRAEVDEVQQEAQVCSDCATSCAGGLGRFGLRLCAWCVELVDGCLCCQCEKKKAHVARAPERCSVIEAAVCLSASARSFEIL